MIHEKMCNINFSEIFTTIYKSFLRPQLETMGTFYLRKQKTRISKTNWKKFSVKLALQ